MKTFTVACMLVMTVVAGSNAQSNDSTKVTLQILPRLHYGGYFPFTGALLNHNPVADVNIFFERNSAARTTWGFFVFQSVDIKDRHSYANYFQPGIFATMKLHPAFKVRGFFGYIFSQAHGFRDADSDYYTAVSLYWDPVEHLSIQSTLLYYDLIIQDKLANRLLISGSWSRFKADFLLWNRFVLTEKRQAVSASVAITFPIIRLSEKTRLQVTSAYMWYLTDYKPSFALEKGFLFTVGVPVDVQN